MDQDSGFDRCWSDSDFMTGQTLVVDGGTQMHYGLPFPSPSCGACPTLGLPHGAPPGLAQVRFSRDGCPVRSARTHPERGVAVSGLLLAGSLVTQPLLAGPAAARWRKTVFSRYHSGSTSRQHLPLAATPPWD